MEPSTARTACPWRVHSHRRAHGPHQVDDRLDHRSHAAAVPRMARYRCAGPRGGEHLREEPSGADPAGEDRKSTRLNSSHRTISYAVFCLKKKKGTGRACSWLVGLTAVSICSSNT